MTKAVGILLPAVLALAPSWAWPHPSPPPPTARVVDVHDGDTVRLETQQRVRLWGIDAHELRQPWGKEAQAFFPNRATEHLVELAAHGTDRYGRVLAVVRIQGRSVNEELLRRGLQPVARH